METLADLAPTEADLRAAYRRLGPVERARMGWRAGRVRAGASVEEAGLIWWRARRDLAHQWWTVPLLAIVGLTGYLAIAETTGHREALVWLVPYLTGVPVMVFVNRPRLCRAMEANAARVNEVSGASLSTSSPRPTRSAYLVVVVALLLAVTVGDSLVQAATRALGARTMADVAGLDTRVDPEVALQPVQPPRALVDGAEPGAVPDIVVRHVDGPVVGARLADSLAFDLSECRLPRLFGSQDASPP